MTPQRTIATAEDVRMDWRNEIYIKVKYECTSCNGLGGFKRKYSNDMSDMIVCKNCKGEGIKTREVEACNALKGKHQFAGEEESEDGKRTFYRGETVVYNTVCECKRCVGTGYNDETIGTFTNVTWANQTDHREEDKCTTCNGSGKDGVTPLKERVFLDKVEERTYGELNGKILYYFKSVLVNGPVTADCLSLQAEIAEGCHVEFGAKNIKGIVEEIVGRSGLMVDCIVKPYAKCGNKKCGYEGDKPRYECAECPNCGYNQWSEPADRIVGLQYLRTIKCQTTLPA